MAEKHPNQVADEMLEQLCANPDKAGDVRVELITAIELHYIQIDSLYTPFARAQEHLEYLEVYVRALERVREAVGDPTDACRRMQRRLEDARVLVSARGARERGGGGSEGNTESRWAPLTGRPRSSNSER